MSNRLLRRWPDLARTSGFAVLVALAACGSPDEKAAKAVARFEVRYAQRDLYGARVEIKRALAIRDDIAEYWNKLGRVELGSSHYLPAYSAYTRALELEPENAEALQAVAELSYSGGKPDDAAKYAGKMLAREPRNLRMLFVKGSVDYDHGDYDAARQIAASMLGVDPRNEGGAILMSRARFAQGETAPAIDQIGKAIAEQGESVPKLVVLLDFYRGLNDADGVDRTYGRLAIHDPQSVELGIEHAREMYEFERPERALQVVDLILRSHPGDDAAQQQVIDLWTALGPDVVGMDQIRHVAAAGTDRTRIALAKLAVDQRRPAEAMAMLRPYLGKETIGPDNIQARVVYAAAISALGRKAEARALVEKLLAFDKTNPQALLLRVNIGIDQGKLAEALTDAQLLARDNPEMPEAPIVIARIYMLRGERILADATFARAATDLSDDLVLMRAYSDYLLASGRLRQAIDAATTFTSRNEKMLGGWVLRGNLCLQAMDQSCLDAVLAVLPQLRSGARAKAALAAAIAERSPERSPERSRAAKTLRPVAVRREAMADA
jgi:tetratricopeptide (TPR) repeat protein